MKISRASRLMFQLPTQGRLINKLHPQSQWGWAEVLANKTNFLLEILIWQKAFDPKKKAEHKRQKPKPFIPDFMKEKPKPSPINEGSLAMDTDDIRSILEAPRQ